LELRRSTPRERKFSAVVQAAHFIAVEPLLLDFEAGCRFRAMSPMIPE